MMERDAGIRDFLIIIKRRRLQIIIPALLIFGISTAIVYFLPNIYKSSGTIMIESQEIPKNLVHSTVTDYAEDRLQMITRTILSHARLMDLFQSYDLYPEFRDVKSTEEIIGRMRDKISVQSIRSDNNRVSDTIAFTISYEGKNPRKVAQVADDLVTAYLEENKKNREKKAQVTINFLEGQLEELKVQISDTEKKIAEFKDRHINQLPRLIEYNLQSMDHLDRDIKSIEGQIRTLTNRKIYLQGQLSTVEPVLYSVGTEGNRIVSPQTELSTLKAQYLVLKTTLSDSHPDVISLRKKIAAMETVVTSQVEVQELYRSIEEKEIKIAQLKKKFSSKHPDVIKIQKELDRLKTEVNSFSEKQSTIKIVQQKPNNPLYINLQTQITTTQMEIEKTQKEIKTLKSKYKDYRKRVENLPNVELEYLSLQRNYANAQEKYEETMDRLFKAKETKKLEESHIAERFTLVEKPKIPVKPFKPKRLKLLALAFILALSVGVIFAFLAENMQQSILRAEELSLLTGKTVLGVIPYIETPIELFWHKSKKWIFLFSFVAVAIILLVTLHYQYKPLNALWIEIKQKTPFVF